MPEFSQEAQELINGLPDDLDVNPEEIEASLRELVEEYNVQLEEAVRSTSAKQMRDYDGDQQSTGGSDASQDEDMDISELTVEHDESWMNIRGTVERLLDLTDKQETVMTQRGVIGDDTGTTIFTTFNDAVEADPSLELNVGESYELLGVVGDAYKGNIGVKITSTTTANPLDEEFSPPDNDSHVTGSIVSVQEVSGLVKRCSDEDCTRVIDNGRCQEHGKVDGDFDLRLKTVIDDGEKAHRVFFGREATEALTGIALEEAVEIAEDAMDTTAVIRVMEPMILGRYYTIAGNLVGENIIVNQFERVKRDWDDEAADMLETLSQSETAS
jgi:replication factor A1